MDKNMKEFCFAGDGEIVNRSLVVSDRMEGIESLAVNVGNLRREQDDQQEVRHLFMSCPKCDESYSEKRIPRNLECGHSLCTMCISEKFKDSSHCSECCKYHVLNSASDLPINYPLLRLIRAVKNNAINMKDFIVPQHLAQLPDIDLQLDGGECPAHDCPIQFMCASCSSWVCRDCLVLEHPIFPRGGCEIVSIKEAIDLIKKEHGKDTDVFLKDVKHVKTCLDSEMEIYNLSKKYCHFDLRSHSRLVQIIKQEFKELREGDDETIVSAMESLKTSQEVLNKTSSPQQITASCLKFADSVKTLKNHISTEEERIEPLRKNLLSHLRMDLKLLAEEGKPVYAVLEGKAGTRGPRYALITSRMNRLMMCSLRDGKPPVASITVSYKNVQDLTKNSGTVFFEVGSAEEEKGLVLVHLFSYYGIAPRNKEVILLCTGERGTSYRNTCFYDYDQEKGLLKGGDHENNDGTGSDWQINEDDAYFEQFARSNLIGLFTTEENSYSKFRFHLKKNLGNQSVGVLGRVIHGLDTIISASKVQPVTNSIVRDCGICIPMNIKD